MLLELYHSDYTRVTVTVGLLGPEKGQRNTLPFPECLIWTPLFHSSFVLRLHHPHRRSKSHPGFQDFSHWTLALILSNLFFSSKPPLLLGASGESQLQAVLPKVASPFSSLDGEALKEKEGELATPLKKC